MDSTPKAHQPLQMIDASVLEALFDVTPDTEFFVKNRQGEYVTVNATMVERSGLGSKCDLIGRTTVEVFGVGIGRDFWEQDRRVIEEGIEIRDHLERHLNRSHAPGWCLTYKVPLRDPSGEIVGLIGISKDLHPTDEYNAVFEHIAEALDRIQRNFAEPLRIEDLAKLAGLSLSRFERYVKRLFNLTPRQLLAKTRLDAASSMLRGEPEKTVAEIAHACGYSDHSAFSRQFKTVTGMTPSEFRQGLAA